ncbi:FitA-like ribbon-helix-helix domain-containing protein [Pseudolysinimonas kribbensis]|nr:hypothetical protein [Pseudolysinimonas kribbensis]
MTVMLQVRNLPDDVHARLKERAAEARMSLSDYVAMELAKLVEFKTNDQLLAEFHARHPDIKPLSREEIVANLHAAQAERDAELDARFEP